MKPFEKGNKKKLFDETGMGVRVVGGGHYGGTLSSIRKISLSLCVIVAERD